MENSINSVQFSSSVMSDSLWLQGLQHTRLPCPSPTPGACSKSCPSSQWRHPAISPSAIPFSSCLQSFPESGSFPESVLCIRWPKYWSFSFSIRPSNEYSGFISFRIDWFYLLAVQGTLKSLFQHQFKIINSSVSALFIVQLSHPYMTTEKTIALTRWTLMAKQCLCFFNMLSRLVIAFLPRSKCLNFMAAVTICSDFGAQKIKSLTVFIISPSICHEVMGPDDISFLNAEF